MPCSKRLKKRQRRAEHRAKEVQELSELPSHTSIDDVNIVSAQDGKGLLYFLSVSPGFSKFIIEELQETFQGWTYDAKFVCADRAVLLSFPSDQVASEPTEQEQANATHLTKLVLSLKGVMAMHTCLCYVTGIAPTRPSLDVMAKLMLTVPWESTFSILKVAFPNLTFDTTGGESKVRFRATSERYGKHAFSSPDVSRRVGGGCFDMTGWNVDLNNFDVEIYTILVDEALICGARINAEDIRRRNRVQTGVTGLHPSQAHLLSRMVRSKIGDIVIDPMCGCGTLPIEGNLLGKGHWACFGGDLEQTEVSAAKANVDSCKVPVDIIRWNATNLPIRSGCLDAIVCDLPFGQRCSKSSSLSKEYPRAFREWTRVLREGGVLVAMTLARKRLMMSVLESLSHSLKLYETMEVNIGNYQGVSVYCLRKMTLREREDMTKEKKVEQPTV